MTTSRDGWAEAPRIHPPYPPESAMRAGADRCPFARARDVYAIPFTPVVFDYPPRDD